MKEYLTKLEMDIDESLSRKLYNCITQLLIGQPDYLSGIATFLDTRLRIKDYSYGENKRKKNFPSTPKWFKALIYATRNGWTEIHHGTS